MEDIPEIAAAKSVIPKYVAPMSALPGGMNNAVILDGAGNATQL